MIDNETVRKLRQLDLGEFVVCFAIAKYIVLQRKVHNVATQYFPFNYSVFDNAFFNR